MLLRIEQKHSMLSIRTREFQRREKTHIKRQTLLTIPTNHTQNRSRKAYIHVRYICGYQTWTEKNLKSANVVVVSKKSSQGLERLPFRIPGTKHHAHIDQGLDPVRSEKAQMPSHDRTPVMANDEDLVLVAGYCVEERNEVAHHKEAGVTVRRSRRVRVAVSAEVRCHGPVAERG